MISRNPVINHALPRLSGRASGGIGKRAAGGQRKSHMYCKKDHVHSRGQNKLMRFAVTTTRFTGFFFFSGSTPRTG